MHTLTLQPWLFWLMVAGAGVVGILIGIALVFRNPPKDIRLQTKFFFTCYLVLSEGSPVYHSYIVNVPGEYPSAKDIKTFCDAVVKNNSEITTCVVLSINRLRE